MAEEEKTPAPKLPKPDHKLITPKHLKHTTYSNSYELKEEVRNIIIGKCQGRTQEIFIALLDNQPIKVSLKYSESGAYLKEFAEILSAIHHIDQYGVTIEFKQSGCNPIIDYSYI